MFTSAEEVLFSRVSVRLSKTTDEIFMNFYGLVGRKGPTDQILSDLDPRSRSLKVKKVKKLFK